VTLSLTGSNLVPGTGLVAIGSDLFILSDVGTVVEVTTSGAIVGTPITGLGSGGWGIATDGTNLFIGTLSGGTAPEFTVGEYTTSGVLVSALSSPVDPIPGPRGLAVAPIPEPSTLPLVLAGLAIAALRIARRRRDPKPLKA
jgi:hypothetical protein